MATSKPNAASTTVSFPVWLLGRCLSLMTAIVGWLMLAFVLSVLLEWVLVATEVWPPDHSRFMIQREVTYLAFLPDTVWGVSGAEMALTMISQLEQWGLVRVPQAVASGTHTLLQVANLALAIAINILMLMSVRLVVVLCALPAFVLIGLVAFIDGFVERDIRRHCGAPESAWLYHLAKPWLVPLFIVSAVIYLTLPVSIHPVLIFTPAMVCVAIAVYVTAFRFKLYA